MLSEIINAYLLMLFLVTLVWGLSVYLRDVSIVDSVWSLLFLVAVIYWLSGSAMLPVPHWLVFSLVLLWSVRLCLYLTVRNWGKPEDRRYVEIRNKYQPNFSIKSFFIIFLFQATLAIIIALPLWAVFSSHYQYEYSWLSGLAIVLWVIGFGFETVADQQLYRFIKDRKHHNTVLSTGLWRYSRHPNYFGEFLLWWAFYLFALDANAVWTVVSPLLMSFLLLRFSGVTLLEKDMAGRRPEYLDYCKVTNAFFPWFRKRRTDYSESGLDEGR